MKLNWKNFFIPALAVILPSLILFAIRAAFMQEDHETCEDTYWHVAAARRPVKEMIRKNFPITLSVWRDHFADKELGFHFYMKCYVLIKDLCNSQLRPPFNGALLPLFLLIFLAWVICAHRGGIPPVLTLLLSLTTALITVSYTYRLMMIRPHLLSTILMLMTVFFLMRGVERWQTTVLVFMMGFLYAWCYSTPHLVWVPAFLFGIAAVRTHKWKAFLPFSGALLGVPAGLLIHPQFPNTFLIWKVQGIDALLAPLDGEIPDLPYARELLPPAPEWLLYSIPVFILLYIVLMLTIRAIEKKLLHSFQINTVAMILISIFWTAAMTFVSVRPIEYAVPMLTLTIGMVLNEARRLKLFDFCAELRGPAVLLTILLVLESVCTIAFCGENLTRWTKKNTIELAQYLKKNLRPGTRVINLNWGDFPEFYFNAPEFEYTWGLDPMFTYAYDKKRTALLSKCIIIRQKVSSYEVGDALNADYAIATGPNGMPALFLADSCGWKIIFQHKSGCIFRLR